MVLTHLREKEIMDNSLPSSIVIGPFYINVDNVKQSLSKKRKALATSMLDILAKHLHKEVEDVSSHSPPGPAPVTEQHLYPCVQGELQQARCLQSRSGVSADTRPVEGPGSHPALTLAVYRELSHMGGQKGGAATSSKLVGNWELLMKNKHPEMGCFTELRVCKCWPPKLCLCVCVGLAQEAGEGEVCLVILLPHRKAAAPQ